jgi:hypothetical protein
MLMLVYRSDDYPFHFELDWHPLCALAALSILFMVCVPVAVHCLEDVIPGRTEVRSPILEYALSLTLRRLAILASIEYAWNVYPSTALSSSILCLANAALVAGIWFGNAQGRTLSSSPNQRRASPSGQNI